MTKRHGRSRADRRKIPDVTPSLERRAPAPRELEVRVKAEMDNRTILQLKNEFVSQNYYLLEEVLERLSPHKPGMQVEVDLSRVPYADSEALGRLYTWAKKLAKSGASLIIVNPTPYVTSIMEILHLDTALAVVHRHSFPSDENPPGL